MVLRVASASTRRFGRVSPDVQPSVTDVILRWEYPSGCLLRTQALLLLVTSKATGTAVFKRAVPGGPQQRHADIRVRLWHRLLALRFRLLVRVLERVRW